MMRIAVHDFGGYPFIVELSRELAARGHEVFHLYAEGFRTPRGDMQPIVGHPSLTLEPVTLAEPIERSGWGRVAQERRYARLLTQRIAQLAPDVVISANTPIEVQGAVAKAADGRDAAFVFWLQDLHSVAIARVLSRRNRMLGRLIGWRFERIEKRLLRQADPTVAISRDFLPVLQRWGVPADRIEVIENWAPIHEPVRSARSDQWAAEHGLGRPLVLYAGTLAFKHNPALLLELARGLPHATVAVVAEGPGADWLREQAGVENLRVLPLQPIERVPDMLAAADLLVAVLEPDASSFSAPSKVLTYLSAGRAILAAMPADNAAARLIVETSAGRVVDPMDTAGLVSAARTLLDDPQALASAGAAGHAYAAETFDLERIGARFEEVAYRAMDRKSRSPSARAADTGSATDSSHEAGT
ncbi:MAG TPA: glycosyltransferase family 4 protein [Candidatus Limnocylindria bacterium]|nr:glycosyltransferase family 4 protein [Candidatus Limnocylindria bacterium]